MGATGWQRQPVWNVLWRGLLSKARLEEVLVKGSPRKVVNSREGELDRWGLWAPSGASGGLLGGLDEPPGDQGSCNSWGAR